MLVAVCFFLSGAAALILQVLWTRMLGHVFGATALAVSTVVTMFMGGLALGSYVGGRWAERLRRPLLTFAGLEAAVGGFGLAVPGLLAMVPDVQAALAPAALGFWGRAGIRFLLVAGILIGPTTAMGATLPVLAEGVVRRNGDVARQVGQLYAANTFGAVIGAVAGGFVLIPQLGMTATVRAAAAVDLLVAGLVVVYAARRRALSPNPPRPAATILATSSSARSGGAGSLSASVVAEPTTAERRRLLTVFALSGAAAMALEVLWTRAVGVVIGASTYSFTLILATFLVGLAAGAAAVTRWMDRVRDPVAWLAISQLVVGVAAIAAVRFVDRLPVLFHALARSERLTLTGLYAANILVAGLVMLPSTLALGMVMPLVVKGLAPSGEARVGRVVGLAYALNTVGAIAGGFLAGFVMLPTLGVERGVAVAALVSISLGVWLAWGRARLRVPALAVAAGCVVIVVAAPGWDVRAWTAGLFRMYLARGVYADGWRPSGNVVYHRDGIATTVTVERELDGVGVALKVNGKVDASDIGDMPTQILSGLLPVMLHPRPRDVLVIGYGSGVTPGAVLQAPVRRLWVAEIEARVYEAADTFFSHVNHEPHRDPRANLVVDDGRNFLRTHEGEFDVIVSEPSNPWMTGAASLFTTDFFYIATRRLRPDGVFLQWLQLYELSTANVQTLIRTFRSAFDQVLLFTPDPMSSDLLMVGSRRPLIVDRARIATFMQRESVRKELARGGFEAPEDIVGLLVADEARLDAHIGAGPLNTDDNAHIEFSAPKDLLIYATTDAELPFVTALDGHRLETVDGPGLVGFGPPWLRLAERLLWTGRFEDVAMAIDRARAAKEAGTERLARLLRFAEGYDDEPVIIADPTTEGDRDYARAAAAVLGQRDDDALSIAESASGFADRSLAHRMLLAFLCYRGERFEEATELFQDVVADDAFVSRYPSALYYAGRAILYNGEYRRGLALLAQFEARTRAES